MSSHTDTHTPRLDQPGLIDEGLAKELTAREGARRARARGTRSTWNPDLGTLARGAWSLVAGTDAKRRWWRRWGPLVGPAAAVALGLGAYFALRPMPTPDYERDNIRRVLTYTMLRDEFNRLPLEQRLELVRQLVARFRGMSASESALMAAFAAGIAGKAREQITENASRLAIDLWDKYAREYEDVPPEEREKFLERTFLEFTRTMEGIGGEVSDKSDEERLADARRQAERDQNALRSGDGAPPARAMARMAVFMRENVEVHASPAQRVRGQVLMRDMTNFLRGGR